MTRTFTPDEIAVLIAKLEAAKAGSLELNAAILAHLGFSWRGMDYWHKDEKTIWKTSARLTNSVDAAMALVPGGCNYLLGRGRTRPDEPIFGAIIFSGPFHDNETELGEGETNASLAIALCIAALKARASIRASGPRPTGEPGANKPPSPEASGPVGRGFDEAGELPGAGIK